MVALLDGLVRAESPSTVTASHGECLVRLAGELEAVGYRARRLRGQETGDHLFARPRRGAAHAPYQLVVDHLDTVWPLGSVERLLPRLEDGRFYGPGAYDAKGGLVQLVFALRALDELGRTPSVVPAILVTSDEEIGSVDSRRHLRRLARGAVRALVLEPSSGRRGQLKTGRKGAGWFRVTVRGRAAHAGASPENGVSAILELSHQVQRLFALNDATRGVSVNVGRIDGGLRPNVVAPEATAVVDARAPTAKDAVELERVILGLRPVQAGVSVTVTGGFGHPPMPKTARNRALCRRAQVLAGELGLDVGEAPIVGGASDANLTSPFTATLDGLGPIGEGAHADHEHVVVSSLAERAALLALLLLEPAPSALREPGRRTPTRRGSRVPAAAVPTSPAP